MNQKELKKLLHYDKETGVFTWLVDGQIAGSPKCEYDYTYVTIFGRGYGLHILAFLYVNGEFPKYQVKHTNQKPFDNRWCNLVEFTPEERNNDIL